MKVRIYTLLVCLLCISVASEAQYFEDALRFGSFNRNLGGTARMQAIGGAQTALGGDISSATVNPAGLGFFNKSVFVVSPSIDFINANTEFGIFGIDGYQAQGSEEAFRNNFNFANIGTVINFGKGRYTDDKFKGGSLAISISRNNSFHLLRDYQGENGSNSIIDNIIQDAGNEVVVNLSELGFAAFDQFLISPIDGGYGAFVGGFPVQRESIEERGSHYQFNVAWGGNYDDRLYFGGGMGVQILNYRQERVYEEFDFLLNSTDQDSLNAIRVDDQISVRGRGVNFNLGLIYRPVQFLTVGASYTSPTFLSLDEESFLDLAADWDAGSTFTETVDGIEETFDLASIDPYQSNLFVNQYRLRTPQRVNLGAALFVGKNGFLSGDLEFVNYATSNINSTDFSTSEDNDLIDQALTSVMNIRVGGEYRIENFRLRAGYAIFPDPVKNSAFDDLTSVSFGFGYRTFDYFLDFAVVSSSRQEQAVPYFIDGDQPVATSDITNTTVSVTFGLNF